MQDRAIEDKDIGLSRLPVQYDSKPISYQPLAYVLHGLRANGGMRVTMQSKYLANGVEMNLNSHQRETSH